MLTGRLSLATHPWLADHQVAGNVLLPGAAFAELAVRAGDEAGCGLVEELVLQAPLVLPGRGGVQLRVSVSGPSDDGHRTAEVHSRHDEAGAGAPWAAHAAATLAATAPAPAFDLAAWPPPGAQPVDVGGVYEALAGRGLGYGPAFRGLTAAWRRGEEVFAEVALPEAVAADGYGLHPALLDAALHAIGLHSSAGRGDDVGPMLPFAWSGVALHAAGAHVLRVRVTCTAPDTFSLQVADSVGSPVASVNSLMLRQVDPAALTGPGRLEWLFGVEWQPHEVAVTEHAAGSGVVVLGDGGLAGLGEVPPVVVAACAGGDGPVPAGTQAAVDNVLGLVQAWVVDDRFAGSRLVVVTRGAVAALAGEAVSDLAGAAVWGLVASGQAEHPGQLVLADTDAGLDERVLALIAAVGDGEPRLAIRKGQALVPRLARAGQQDVLALPPGRDWRLEAAERGTLEGLALASTGEPGVPLEAGQVRVDVRAAGLNFLDVFVALGMGPGQGRGLGAEGAGVVIATGPGVVGLAVSDAVMGIMPGAFGPVAVTDHRLLAPIPAGWSFAEAATVPVAFATAYYALVDLAGLRAGESVLIHAAAGGVGMAAVQIARHLGAEVFATASPGKWEVLAAVGLDAAHIASSRDLGFGQAFRDATGGRGVDVVLDCLRGEFVDASLRLLAPGGRFVEMGKTDIRDPHQVASDYGVSYQAFDLMDPGPERIGQILAELGALFGSGALSALPRTVFDVRQARAALRWMSQAGHTGKIVLSIPQPLDRDGSVLVTGGTGALGRLTARHLATTHHVRQLILTSRRGPHASGAAAMAADLAGLGTHVTVAAGDVADRGALAGLLARIAAEHQLTGVVHAAGVLDDALVGLLTPERVAGVLAAKADAAWFLHELTQDLGLGMFVLFSSAAGVLGSPGQASYAAANAFLDALAGFRQARGLAGVSVAWGLWEAASEMVGQSAARVAARGVGSLTAAEGLALLDAALERGQASVVAARLDAARLAGRGDAVPPLLSGLVRSSGRGLAAAPQGGGGLAQRLAGLPAGERAGVVAGLVRANAAVVLGHGSAQDVDPGRAFRDLGFDSLTAVELRNRLGTVTGLRLPATAVFDYPTPATLTAYVLSRLGGGPVAAAGPVVPVRASAGDDPVVIVGMSCRFPGGADSPAQFWDLVATGRDAVGGFPDDRGWAIDTLFDPDPDHAGTSYACTGGFLLDAAGFDAGFFGISPREALAMDPQQRLLLEACWSALEDAGIDPAGLRGTPAGVFAGIAYSDYAVPLQAGGQDLGGFASTGTAYSVASGRVAYTLGLEGPAVSVDTACSSSLVALHLAAQSLRSGECSLALVGGVTVMATPVAFTEFSRQRGLAADGRCKAFADAADGTGWGEGVGVLVVERLSVARLRGHRVLAVVAGSAVNQDGASNGLTAPNGPSQQRVIRQALASAGLGAGQVDVVEAHGTGTTLGDPIEAQALIATYGLDRGGRGPLLLGSVKSNIGHTQAAAGVAGVIKMVAAMRHGIVPPTLHVDAPSSHVDWSAGAVGLVTEATPWPETGEPRRAAVSGFGFSGTNAHVILEQAPAEHDPDQGGSAEAGDSGAGALEGLVVAGAVAVVPWVVSARSAAGLRAQAQRLAEFTAAADAGVGLADVGWSLAVTRSALAHRAVVTGSSRDELLAGLEAVAAGEPAAQVVTGAAEGGAGKVVFVFPGQGSQWAGMAAGLAGSCPVFAARLAQCAGVLDPLTGWPLVDTVCGRGASLDRVEVVQPALWAVMVSLAAVWQAAGVTPDAVVGHSQGEIAAAVVAGVLSLADGAKVVALRSQALAQLAGTGGMVSVAEPAEMVQQRLGQWDGRVHIAAVNGPGQVVVSGDAQALDELAAVCERDGVRARRVEVDYASHSPRIEAVRVQVEDALAGVSAAPGSVTVVSGVDGQVIDGTVMDGGYWYRSLREPVQFHRAVRTLAASGHRIFIEVSPHPVLTTAVEDTLTGTSIIASTSSTPASSSSGADAGAGVGTGGVVVTGTLRRDDGGLGRLAASLAQVWVAGGAVDWSRWFPGLRSRVDLPTYAFQRQRYWPGRPAVGGDPAGLGLVAAGHPLLGAAVELPESGGVVLTGRLSLATQPWLADHQVAGTVLLPGAAFAELAVRAADEAGCGLVEELVLQAPLVLPERGGVQVRVSVSGPGDDGRRSVEVYSRRDDAGAGEPWTVSRGRDFGCRPGAGAVVRSNGVAAAGC